MKGKNVDISNENPHVCSNILKSYLRELPEPLFTYNSYEKFINTSGLFYY